MATTTSLKSATIRSTGSLSTSVGNTDSYQKAQAEQKAARHAFIAKLDKIVYQAGLIADELVHGRDRDIADYMIIKYFLMSISSGDNQLAWFSDVREATVEELMPTGIPKTELLHATRQTNNALKGAHRIVAYSKNFSKVVNDIKAPNRKLPQRNRAAKSAA